MMDGKGSSFDIARYHINEASAAYAAIDSPDRPLVALLTYPLLEGASVESSNRLNLHTSLRKSNGRFAWH